jgi:hypothetical protein
VVSGVTFDFGVHPFDETTDRVQLTVGAQRLLSAGDSGGSSLLSEVVALEVLTRCEGAALLKSTTEIGYDRPTRVTDLMVLIAGRKVGVNVTRACAYPFGEMYTAQLAETLLVNALVAINQSTANVTRTHLWVKQILVVVSYNQQHADTITATWGGLAETLTTDTILYVIVTDGSDRQVYGNA